MFDRIRGWRLFWLVCVLVGLAVGAVAQIPNSNYREAGGLRWVIGGSIDIESGGEIDVESGGSLKIAGTAVTSTAAELNILDTVTATAAELNILDTVTATAAELNRLDASARAAAVISLATGTLTVNSVHIATATADYDLPDSCDTATGNWVTLIVQDASETASLTVLAAEDEIKVGGVNAAANEEIDSSGTAAGDGDSITVECLVANVWFATAQSGIWVDGGPAD